MLKGEILSDFTNQFPPNNFKDNGKIILKYIYKKWIKHLVCIQIYVIKHSLD